MKGKSSEEKSDPKSTSWLLDSRVVHEGGAGKKKGKKSHMPHMPHFSFSSKTSKASHIAVNASVEPPSGDGVELSYGAIIGENEYGEVATHDEEKGEVGDEESDFEGEEGEPNELHLIVVEAKGLAASDLSMFGEKSSDPYCTVKFRGREKQTMVVKHTLDPHWGKKFIFPLGRASKDEQMEGKADRKTSSEENQNTVIVTVVDNDTMAGMDNLAEDDKLGEASISIDGLTNEYSQKWLSLQGRIQGTKMFGKMAAKGQVLVKAKVVRNPARARLFTIDEPLSPPGLKYAASAACALVWLVAFVSSLVANMLASILEYVAAICLTLLVHIFTGMNVSIGGLSIRFGPGSGPTEIVINQVKIMNPSGGYESEYLAHIVRIDLHIHLLSYFAAKKWVEYSYLTEVGVAERTSLEPPPRGQRPEHAAFKIDMVRIDGLTVYTEKNTSPLVDEDKMLVNVKALLKMTDEPQEDAAAEEKQPKEEKRGNKKGKAQKEEAKPIEGLELPKAAKNVPLLFQMRNLIMTDVNLFAADIIADALGDPDGCGSIKKQTPIEIDQIIASFDDFHDEKHPPHAIWLGDLIKVVTKKALPKIPLRDILSTAMHASGSKWGGDLYGSQRKIFALLGHSDHQEEDAGSVHV